jgi:hypothetical protein
MPESQSFINRNRKRLGAWSLCVLTLEMTAWSGFCSWKESVRVSNREAETFRKRTDPYSLLVRIRIRFQH